MSREYFNMDKQTILFDKKERIAHILMLNSFFESNIGLFEGQVGIAISMCKFYEYTNNDIYSEFVYDLLETILSKVNKGLPFSLATGLSGIGWGVEYLIQNKFVEGESVEICEEIDNKIMETDPRRIKDYSLETGFEGLLLYIVYHLHGTIQQGSKLPFDSTYLSDIYSVCKNLKDKDISESLRSLLNIYIAFAENKTMTDFNPQIIRFTSNVPEIDYDNLTTYPLGLNNGLAGALVDLIEKDN